MDFDLPVLRVMTANPVTVQARQHVNEARTLLAAESIHHLPVVEDDRLVGIISSSDIVKLGMALHDGPADGPGGVEDDSYTVDAVMHRHPIAVGVDATVREAARILATGGFHSLPVVGYNNILKGIVTSTDLINLLIKRL
ncbi:MAG: CBS domain-containing protein [Pseudomonadota bacterium]